jgi:DNA-binding HxlR family transcriptional regulator
MKEIKKRSYCPISSALDIIGDKWSLLIIRDIALVNKHTYGEFLSSEEKIATNILADRLALLEWAKIIVKEPHPENKTKYNYFLSQKGIDLLPVLLDLIIWSDKYNEISKPAKEMAKQLKKDREGVLQHLTEMLKAQLKR